jgi:hypothetical protein
VTALVAAVSAGSAPGVRVYAASTARLSRVAEDADSHLPADREPVTGVEFDEFGL